MIISPLSRRQTKGSQRTKNKNDQKLFRSNCNIDSFLANVIFDIIEFSYFKLAVIRYFKLIKQNSMESYFQCIIALTYQVSIFN